MGSLEVVSFSFGMILLFVAILGGGFEVQKFKMPKASWLARVFSAFAGCALIVLALVIADIIPFPNGESADPNTTIILNAVLGKSEDGKEKEIETKLRVRLNEQVVEFSLNSESPSESHTLKLAEPGEYQYSIDGYSKWSTDPNNSVPVEGSDTMFIHVGHIYTVEMEAPPTASAQTWGAYLVDISNRRDSE